jgi:Flp pilus assembly pilin Flp
MAATSAPPTSSESRGIRLAAATPCEVPKTFLVDFEPFFFKGAQTMKSMIKKLGNFVKEEEGAIAVEYILLILFVALAVLAGGGTFAGSVSDKYGTVGGAVSGAPIGPLQ